MPGAGPFAGGYTIADRKVSTVSFGRFTMKLWRAAVLLIMMIAAVVFSRTANAQVGTNQNAPAWQQIENSREPMDFKILWGPSSQIGTDCQQGFNCEWLNSTADVASDTQRVRIPMTYYAFTGPNNPGAETSF